MDHRMNHRKRVLLTPQVTFVTSVTEIFQSGSQLRNLQARQRGAL